MLNQRIRQLRQARSMSQVDLAKRLNVTKQSVSNWENLRRHYAHQSICQAKTIRYAPDCPWPADVGMSFRLSILPYSGDFLPRMPYPQTICWDWTPASIWM